MTDEQSERLQMRVSKEFLKVVDMWRRKQEDIPNRSEAIRRLVELGLKSRGK
jgi:metal-responsive CopG/Arc/MetJ family transcriptional regulator